MYFESRWRTRIDCDGTDGVVHCNPWSIRNSVSRRHFLHIADAVLRALGCTFTLEIDTSRHQASEYSVQFLRTSEALRFWLDCTSKGRIYHSKLIESPQDHAGTTRRVLDESRRNATMSSDVWALATILMFFTKILSMRKIFHNVRKNMWWRNTKTTGW